MELRKIKIVEKEFLILHQKTSRSETDENVFLFVSISSLTFFGDGIDMQYFVDVVRNSTSNFKISWN